MAHKVGQEVEASWEDLKEAVKILQVEPARYSPGYRLKTYHTYTAEYGKDTLRPVTIKQVLDAQQPHPDGEFKIDGIEITQITFIGQIRNISTQTTNITYKLDDGTGTIEVKQWIDSDATTALDTTNNNSDNPKPKLIENAYARVWGRLKAFNNKRH
ncbi:MAG: replication factor A protein 2, partial [Pleopsidium flavum]